MKEPLRWLAAILIVATAVALGYAAALEGTGAPRPWHPTHQPATPTPIERPFI